MEVKGGYVGNLLRVNLSNKTYHVINDKGINQLGGERSRLKEGGLVTFLPVLSGG